MLLTLEGIVVFLQPCVRVFVAVSIIALQFSRESYFEFPASTVIEDKALQSAKTPVPIFVTLECILTDGRAEQFEKARLLIVVTLEGIVTDGRVLQLVKAP